MGLIISAICVKLCGFITILAIGIPVRRPQTYTSAEVCELFQITKSTLFRWEELGRMPNVGDKSFPFSSPGRAASGEREYGQQQIREIARYQIERLSRQYDRLVESNADQLLEVQERLSWLKFHLGNPTGLRELMARRDLTWPDTLSLMSKFASDNPPSVGQDEARSAWEVADELARILFGV